MDASSDGTGFDENSQSQPLAFSQNILDVKNFFIYLLNLFRLNLQDHQLLHSIIAVVKMMSLRKDSRFKWNEYLIFLKRSYKIFRCWKKKSHIFYQNDERRIFSHLLMNIDFCTFACSKVFIIKEKNFAIFLLITFTNFFSRKIYQKKSIKNTLLDNNKLKLINIFYKKNQSSGNH